VIEGIKHIVSSFFLSIYLYYNSDLFKKSIDKTLGKFKKQNPHSKIEFSFIWFLICLFHDLGYIIETSSHYTNFETFIQGRVKYFLNQRVGVPLVYEETFKKYFNYRVNSNNDEIYGPDHEICGGILLFNKLNSILIKKQFHNNSMGLSWNKKLIKIYRLASWVILSHNIYFIRKGDPAENDYIRNNLQSLILDKDEMSKIKLEKHSFLYLFLLVDSLDPIKTFNEYENLRNIKIGCLDNKIVIHIEDGLFQREYIKKLIKLKEWLVPDIITTDINKITIILNSLDKKC
jgi:hypothetical protein